MRKIVPFVVSMLVMCACSSIDCPLNNVVTVSWQLMKSSETIDTLHDTISVITKRKDNMNDTVLLNRAVNVTSFVLPISYNQPEDEVYFILKDTLDNVYTDTVKWSKTDQSHFESVDCAPSFFHTISGVSYTTHAIDSIRINKKTVDYETTVPHFFVYFHNRDI